MTHTRSHHRRRRRALLREVPSTVPLLADRAHFSRMRAYRSFAFDDHRRYLRQVEDALRALAAQGTHTRVALFDPVGYEQFCQDEHLDPDTPHSRTRYATRIAAAGTTLPYHGQPLSRLIPHLLDAHSRRLTTEAATGALTRAGACADCGRNLGRAALDRAARALTALLAAASEGSHHLVCSVAVPGTPLIATLALHRPPDTPLRLDEATALTLTSVLAAGIATSSPGALVMRTHGGTESPDTVRGWRLDTGTSWLRPLTAGQVRAAYCTDPVTGDTLAPEPGVRYTDGPDLPGPGGDLHCC